MKVMEVMEVMESGWAIQDYLLKTCFSQIKKGT